MNAATDLVEHADTANGAASPAMAKNIVYVGTDVTHPALILRLESFLAAGARVTGFTFTRDKFDLENVPRWDNVNLGKTLDRAYIQRIFAMIGAVFIMLRHAKTLRAADCVFTHQIDCHVVGILAKILSGSRAKVVYEVDDVQEVFFKATLKGGVFRWIERLTLRFTDLLVLTSPGYQRGYFGPVQNWKGPVFILENKVQQVDPDAPPTSAGAAWESIRDRWVIAWFGTLRCPKSMDLLCALAERLGEKVEIYTRGYPTETGLDYYREKISRYPNITYDGRYKVPDDLEEMYGRAHFSWCFDFLDWEGNSQLLLPYRLYQGGYYGAVPLVAAGVEMAEHVDRLGVGHAFEAPYVEPLARFLEQLSWDDYAAERGKIMEIRRDAFLEDGRDVRSLLSTIAAL